MQHTIHIKVMLKKMPDFKLYGSIGFREIEYLEVMIKIMFTFHLFLIQNDDS